MPIPPKELPPGFGLQPEPIPGRSKQRWRVVLPGGEVYPRIFPRRYDAAIYAWAEYGLKCAAEKQAAFVE